MDQENKPLNVKFSSSTTSEFYRHLRKNRVLLLLLIFIQFAIVALWFAAYSGLIPVEKWLVKTEEVKNVENEKSDFNTPIFFAGHSIKGLTSTPRSVKQIKKTYQEYVQGDTSSVDTIIQDTNSLVFGLDVSNWQGEINWKILANHADSISFILVKATQGTDLVDSRFYRNWAYAKQSKMIFGAYHYFDLKSDPLAQAKFYLRTTHLQKGDLVPIVDVEYPCNCDSLGVPRSEFIQNLKVFLSELENTLNVQPAIYASESFFNLYLEKEFSSYPLWIAAYEDKVPKQLNSFFKLDPEKGSIWQFTNQGSIPGITGNVDLNVSTKNSIDQLRMK